MPAAPPLRQDIVARDRTRAAFESVKRRGQGLAATLGRGLFAGAGLGLAAGLINPLGRASEALEEFDALGKRIRTSGFSSEFFQTLQLAAEEASIDQERFNKATERFVAVLGETKAGRGELVETIRQTHPELVRELQAAKGSDEAFRALARAVDTARTADEKALITKAAFGTRMVNLVRVLDLGEQGLDRTAEKARALGLVIEQDMLDNAEKLQNEYGVASRVIDLNFKKALVDLAPVIVSTTQGFAGMVSGIADMTASARTFFDEMEARKSVVFGDRNQGPGGLLSIGDPNKFLQDFRVPLEGAGAAAADGFTLATQAGIKWETTTRDNIDALKAAEDRARSFGVTVGDAFADAVIEGRSLRDIGIDLASTFARAGINAFAGQLFSSFAGGGGSGSASLFAGRFASGGTIPAGKFGMVGEAGPEFVSGPARVTPVSAGGGIAVSMPVHLDARGAAPEAVAAISVQLENLKREIPGMAVAAIRSAQTLQPGKF